MTRAHTPCFLATALIAALTLTSCAEVPELDEAVPDWVATASYPDLIPLDTPAIRTAAPQQASEDLQEELDARRARLDAKARQLQGKVVDSETEARMARGVAR